MYTSKLFQLIQSFNKKELKNIDLFLKSPFFNQDDKLIRYFSEVCEVISFKKELNKTKVFQNIYGKKKFDDTLLRVLQSNLFKLIEQYLTLQIESKNTLKPKLRLLKYYRTKGFWKPYNSVAKHVEKYLDEAQIMDEEYYLINSLYLTEQIDLQAYRKKIDPQKLQTYYQSTSDLYLTVLLKRACKLLSEKSVFNFTFNLGITPNVIAWISENSANLPPITKVYFAYYKMLEDPKEEQHFILFDSLLKENAAIFSIQELRDLYLAINNYCIKRVNRGDKKYEILALNNYKDALDKKVLFENGLLSQRTYNNIIALALKNKEFNWAEEFMDNFTQTLPAKEQESTYNLNRARLAYIQKEFDRALQLLQGADFKPMLNNLSAKTLMIKLFYETDEFDVLHYQLKAMKAFLYRNKIMGYHKKAFNNLIRYTEKLLRIHKGDNSKIEKMQNAIKKEEIIWEKDWLLNQLMHKST